MLVKTWCLLDLVCHNYCEDIPSVGTGPKCIHTWLCGRLRGQSLQAAPELSVGSSHAPSKNILKHPPLASNDQNIFACDNCCFLSLKLVIDRRTNSLVQTNKTTGRNAEGQKCQRTEAMTEEADESMKCLPSTVSSTSGNFSAARCLTCSLTSSNPIQTESGLATCSSSIE